MKIATIVFLLATLSGCASFDTPKEVSIPVQVPCVQGTPAKPISLFEAAKDKPWYERVDALLIDRANSIIYETGLEAVIEGCK